VHHDTRVQSTEASTVPVNVISHQLSSSKLYDNITVVPVS